MDEEVSADAPKLPLPESFLDFLNDNGLDPSIYAASQSIPRYIRYSSSNIFFFSFFEYLWNNVCTLA